jgi:predicted transcriptional regulator of viral defense system
MDDIVLTKTLRSQGFDDRELGRMRRQGSLIPVRRGAYVRERPADRTLADQHRELILATAPQLHDGAIISHASAATLHRLPTWENAIDRVHVTRNRSSGGNRRSVVQVHTAPLPDEHITTIDGIPVTSIARTVLDLCRTAPIEQAVAAGDRALAYGLARGALEDCLAQMTRWPGTRQARRAIALLDPRSESPGESVSRVRLHQEGLPPPEPQQDIYDVDGRIVARVDFCWEKQRTIGEFDGKIKYGRLLKPGESIEDVIFAEKVREDALRDLGWQIVRWLWADLYRPGVIRDRVLRAFARSSS